MRQTALNFVGSVPVVLALSVLAAAQLHWTWTGLALAVASGALTSGLGYAAWYAALPRLTAARASTVQLSVPVIAALGGVALLGEPLDARLLLASATTLGGIAIVLGARSRGG
jgi:drug/metabolite transporter (DMT)-like permease